MMFEMLHYQHTFKRDLDEPSMQCLLLTTSAIPTGRVTCFILNQRPSNEVKIITIIQQPSLRCS